jgi:hypothetical protein
MASNILVWDLETIPDLEGYARAHDLIDKSPDEIRTAMGDDFPKLIYHSIVCIGALVASRTPNGYEVQVVGAPHVGQRTEKELIESFVNKIGQLSPQMVTFNGGGFDLPVLRYRAMIHGVFAPGMHNRAYYHRYTEDNLAGISQAIPSTKVGDGASMVERQRARSRRPSGCRYVTMLSRRSSPPDALLQALFNLTPPESRVARTVGWHGFPLDF